jgi:hypothetical protein
LPRVRLHIEDGRNFLQATGERFDLITGEPPPPRTPGAVNIYTREYFQLIYERLADGGMTTYWVPVARPNPGTDVNTIIRAFCDVFDDCSLWNGTPYDLMLAGTRHAAGPIAETEFARPWVTPGLESKLREVGFESPQQVGATFLGDSDYLRALTDTERNADISPDGRWLAYESNESGAFEVYVRPFPNVNDGRWQVSTGGGTVPLWARNGREMFFMTLRGELLVAAAILESPGSAAFRSGTPIKLFDTRGYFAPTGGPNQGDPGRTYDVSADGRFLMIKDVSVREGTPAPQSITVIQNWVEELKRRVTRN